MTGTTALPLGPDQTAQLGRLVSLRSQLRAEQSQPTTPAVARFLELADVYLFLALSHFGYVDQLFPEEAFPPAD